MRSKEKADKVVMGPRMVFGYLGIFLVLIGILTALPLVLLAFYHDEVEGWSYFAYPALFDVGLGLFLYFFCICRKKRANFARNENNALLVLIWIAAVLSGAFPFFLANLAGEMEMSFSESFFESASAYSTTGLTCFKDFVDGRLVYDGTEAVYHLSEGVSFCPHLYCFHRAEMQFVGGVGLVLLLSMVLGNSAGMSLYVGEGHGDRLLPNLKRSAGRIFGIYFLYTALGAASLFLAGMEPFDAATTAMAALSGGGFSPRSSNIAYYSGAGVTNGFYAASPLAIQIIVMFLVILSGISFVLHTFLLSGRFKQFFKDAEVRFFFVLLLVGCLISATGSIYKYGTDYLDNIGPNIQNSIFYIVGCATTSGFASTSMSEMVALGKPLIYVGTVLMVIGGGAGSCGGGLKQYRVYIMLKDLYYRMRYQNSPSRILHPHQAYRYGEESEIDDAEVKEASQYTVLFLAFFIVSIIILNFLPEIDSEIAAFNVASAMSNTGLSMTDYVYYGAKYPEYYDTLLWVLAIGCLVGRLEIFPLFYGLSNVKEEIVYYSGKKKAALLSKEE